VKILYNETGLIPSAMAATPRPNIAPTQTPILKRVHSRRHSGQLEIVRLVERCAAKCPMNAQIAALETMANIQRTVPPMTGTPNNGNVGIATIAKMNPGIPRTALSEPMSNKAAKIPITAEIATATYGPHLRTRMR
jgi:hypothetical protein